MTHIGKCGSCGAEMSPGYKYCSECGVAVVVPPAAQSQDFIATAAIVSRPRTAAVAIQVLEIILWLALAGIVAAIVIPAAEGRPSTKSPGEFIVFLAIPYFSARRRHAKHSWAWALAGFSFWLLLTFLASILVAYNRPAAAQDNSMERLLSAVSKFDSGAAIALRSAKEGSTEFQSIFLPLLARAIRRAPDAAVISLASAQQMIILPTSDSDISRCVAAATGKAVDLSNGVTKEADAAVLRAEVDVFRGAADNKDAPAEATQTEVAALLRPIYARVDPNHTMANPETFFKLPERTQCQMYEEVIRGVQQLPVAESATAFRYFIGARLAR